MGINSRKTVFIVDDDPDDRQIILDSFLENTAQIDYIFIENGEQLMNTLHQAGPDELPALILLDLNMPGLPGLQALKQIKNHSQFRDIPTIVLTTSQLEKDQDLSYKFGANCFVQKPGTYTELVNITHSILRLWFQPFLKEEEKPGLEAEEPGTSDSQEAR
ncbi:MAG: response regulator [Bacteroidetes bacterium]|nr:response regulator [Bacteroidota bacterium]